MTTARSPADGPVDEFASDVLKLSPKGIWRTFLAVTKSSWENDDELAIAIASRDRTLILSPFKYIAGTWTLGFLTLWVIVGVSQGHFGEIESFSFLRPEMLPMLIWPFVFAVPLHFVLGGGRRPQSLVNGFSDGLWKIYQLYMYMLGHFMFFFLPLLSGLMIGEMISPRTSLVLGLATGGAGAFVVLYPLIFRAMPGTLAALYGVSRNRALFSAVGVLLAMFAMYSLITTGHLPR
jgi:hypothetical protein